MRRVVRAVAALSVVIFGWTQPVPAANAAFTTSAIASSAVSAHTLETPVLSCSGGGLLSSTVTLSWPMVDSASTPDPYGSAPGSYRLDSYEIHRAVDNGPFSLRATKSRTATSHTDSLNAGSALYHYKILAKKGGWTSSFSEPVTGKLESLLFIGLSASCPA